MSRRKKARIGDEEDRISKLPDDLIHRIMSFMDTRFVVQTSVLSKRWKLVWTTLPFLNFNGYKKHYERELNEFIYFKFINHVFSCRNHQSRIVNLELCSINALNLRLVKKYVNYAISHDVECLDVTSDRYYSLFVFDSDSLKQLKLEMDFENVVVMESDCWSLPNLTTLHLKCNNSKYYYRKLNFPESCLICLPALTTLGLDHCRLPEFLTLPALTTLRLESCTLTRKVWDFPALLTLELTDVDFPENISDYFLALASLQNLAIDIGWQEYIDSCVIVISNSQLLNLKISVRVDAAYAVKIVLLAQKLCNFEATGFFPITFESTELENVNIKFWDSSKFRTASTVLKQYSDLFKTMFSELGSAKILTLDLVTLEALSGISDILVHLRSPFYNLKYLKLPHGCEESSISSSVKQYLLSRSPSATIIKTLVQEDVIPQTARVVSTVAQDVVQEKPLATPTKELIDSKYTHKNMCGDTIDMRVPKEHLVENSVVDADRVRQIEAPVTGASNDRGSSSWYNSNLVLWHGHEVNSEFVGLLDLIMKRYPETFEQLTTKNKKIWTMKLNMLCSSVIDFTKTSMTEVDTNMLTGYKAVFTDLQRWGFNVNWLMSHLNHIEQLYFSKPLHYELHGIDSRINNAKSKLQDPPTLWSKKMMDSESVGTTGTSCAATACYIGDGLL